jgi:hypothetical protein
MDPLRLVYFLFFIFIMSEPFGMLTKKQFYSNKKDFDKVLFSGDFVSCSLFLGIFLLFSHFFPKFFQVKLMPSKSGKP